MQDRRINQRFHLPLPVLIEFETGGIQHVEKTSLMNIGIGGALFEMSRPVPTDSTLQMQLVDPDMKFAEKLGISTDSRVPFRFLVNCTVLRTQDSTLQKNKTAVAVKFDGSLRILGDSPQIERMEAGRIQEL